MLPIQRIRKAAITEEIDYNLILSCLQEYKAPRDVITRLLRLGDLIRVKKGIYVFGKNYSNRPYSLEVLANMIYGPSYVSGEYALSFYGLIPEAVKQITSISTGRNKNFYTPIGYFSYRRLPVSKYQVGITRVNVVNNMHAIMATPEKALADMIYLRKEKIQHEMELAKILYDDYRIDPLSIRKLRVSLIKEIARTYQNDTIDLLPTIIRKEKR